jgi:hypothetical protein
MAGAPSGSRRCADRDITVSSVCVSSGTVAFQVTFHTSQSYYHVFFNTDGNTATGYRLPCPSPSALGADYLIENGGLYRSRSTDWSRTGTATWTLPPEPDRLTGQHPTGRIQRRIHLHADDRLQPEVARATHTAWTAGLTTTVRESVPSRCWTP